MFRDLSTNFLHQFTDYTFNPNYQVTIGVDLEVKTIQRIDLVLKLQLWDLSGDLRFRPIVTSYFPNAWTVVIVYDIGVRSSFESIGTWLKASSICKGISVVIVGNKVDGKREVRYEEGAWLATKAGAVFMETSVTSAGLTKALFGVVEEVTVARARRERPE